jgi:predicted metal-dependent hydrolase
LDIKRRVGAPPNQKHNNNHYINCHEQYKNIWRRTIFH